MIFDTRGVGLSDPLEHIPTVEEGADDLEAVMDAAREREPTRLRATIANMAEAGCCSPSATSAENHA